MERGVEHGDVRQFGQHGAGGTDAGEPRRVVQRCEVGKCLDLTLDRIVDERRPHEAGTAVHDAVTDRVNLVAVKLREHGDHCGLVIGNA